MVFSAQPGDLACIRALGVVRDRREQGLGTLLKQEAVDYFRKIGATGYYSLVDRFNLKMQRINEHRFGLIGEADPKSGKDLYYATTFTSDDDSSADRARGLWQPMRQPFRLTTVYTG